MVRSINRPLDPVNGMVEQCQLYAMLNETDCQYLLTLTSGLTVIADLAAIDPSINSRGSAIWPNTFTQAQKYNLQMQKAVETGFLTYSYYANFGSRLAKGAAMPQAQQTNGFLNGYYDDEGWWALAWYDDFHIFCSTWDSQG